MVLTVTEDIPADMLAGSMELLVQIPRDQYMQTQRVTVQRSTPMMDLLVQIATAHKLAASSYTLQAIGERGLVLPHQPNTPIGALDALQVKLLPKQGTFIPRKNRLPNQPFETTFRLQVHLPRNQLYVSRVSPKTNLGEILDEVCREKNLDRNKYELRHPGNISEALDLNLTLEDYQIQEVNLYPRSPSRALSSQDIMAFQRQEECRRQQSRHQGVFGFMFKKSKESSVSTDSLGNRSVSPARSDETARSSSPIQHSQPRSLLQQQSSQHKQFAAPAVPSRPLRKRRPAPKPPTQQQQTQQRQETMSVVTKSRNENGATHASDKDKIVISHSRNSSDSSGYHEASVLSDHPDTIDRMPETLPRRGRMQGILESPRKLAHTSQASKSLGNLAMASSHGGTLSRGISNTSLSSTGQRKKRAAPPPPMARPLPSAISVQGLERIVDSDESLTSDMDLSKPSSDIEAAATSSSQASSDIACNVRPVLSSEPKYERIQNRPQPPVTASSATTVEPARVVKKGKSAPTDTDILLQKVSDTLSQSFVPPSPPPTPEDEEEVVSLAGPPAGFGNEQLKKKKPEHATVVDAKPTVALGHEKSTAKRQKSRTSGTTTTTAIISSSTGTSINATAAQLEPEEEEAEEEEDRGAPSSNGSAQNLTAASQQDTSDYVSASGEDLSIGDWEYQIPAPPSAFRDDSDAEQPQPPAQQPAKESISIQAEVHPKPAEPRKPSLDAVDFCRPQPRVPKPVTPQQQQPPSDATQQRKAEVISELETKINGSSSVVGHKPAPEVARDDSYAPKIAPVENSLSNFTITTYSRQKSLDIFEPAQLEPAQPKMDPSESRVQAFATLTRGRNGVATEYAEERLLKATGMKNAISMERVSVPLVDERAKFVERNEISRDKAVHRSKSYIVLSTNEKFQNRANEVETSRNEKRLEERSSFESSEPSKKFTSLANVNGSSSSSDEVPRNKEKFSQWRENILRKQEEPSKEKQLQSLQVLKSILPKLKNAQATERSNYSNIGDTFTAKERQEPQREQLRAASPPPSAAPVTTTAPSEVKLRPTTQRRNHEPTKRYTYGGPPAVSLGSWSERPSLNVQIKNDSDYKLGGSGSALSGARTVVNLNAETNEKKEPPTTPVKNTPKEPAKEESCVDTSSVNFRELTKAFGQAEVRLRPKPPVTVRSAVQPQRHSEYLERDGHAPKINGFADSHKVAATTPTTKTNTGFGQNRTNGPATPAKRYTSVVGITSSSSNGGDANEQPNFRFANGGMKQQPAVQPVLKSVNGMEKNAVPKPPTMPIITGVTLKSVSARPKSSPVSIQQDPRDQLLESIRNFGGRDRLKKAAERR